MKRGIWAGLVALSLMVPSNSFSADKDTSAVFQINKDREKALKILKQNGIDVLSLRKTDYSLPTVNVSGLDGPYDFGDLIVLKADIDKSTLPAGLVNIKYHWTILENSKIKTNTVIWPDQTEVFFTVKADRGSTASKKITVVLSVDCLFQTKTNLSVVDANGKPISGAQVVDSNGKVITSAVIDGDATSPEPIVKDIVVGLADPSPIPGPTPTPVPTPTPTPVPTPTPTPIPPAPVIPTVPTFPNETYGFSTLSYDSATKDVPAASRKAAKAIAQNFSSVAAQYSAGTIDKSIKNVLALVKAGNQTALTSVGVPAADWGQFNQKFGDRAFKVYTDSVTNNQPVDWSVILREVAAGLSEVK